MKCAPIFYSGKGEATRRQAGRFPRRPKADRRKNGAGDAAFYPAGRNAAVGGKALGRAHGTFGVAKVSEWVIYSRRGI